MGDLARYIEADIERLSTLVWLVGRVLTTGSLYSAGLPIGASVHTDSNLERIATGRGTSP